MLRGKKILTYIRYLLRSAVSGLAVFLLYLLIYFVLSLVPLPDVDDYCDNNVISVFNLFFYGKATSALKLTDVFRRRSYRSDDSVVYPDLPVITADRADVTGATDAVYAKPDTEAITFDSCIVADKKHNQITKYPIVIQVRHEEPITFSEITGDMTADKIYLLTAQLVCYEPDNFWTAAENKVRIYPFTSGKQHSALTVADIDTIKSSLDAQIGFVELETNRLRSRVLSNHNSIIAEIHKYLSKTTLPEDYQKEMRDVFDNKNNLPNLDEYLNELIDNFRRLVLTDESYADDLLFFETLYKKCIKIDNTTRIIGGQSVNLFDMLYKNKRNYFDNLIITTETYRLSPIAAEIAFSHGTPDGRYLVDYGKQVTFPDGYAIPIDRCGLFELNLLKCGNLNINTADKQQLIYENITKQPPLKRVSSVVTHIFIYIIAVIFVMTLQARHSYPKWLFLPSFALFTMVFYTIMIACSRLLNLASFGIIGLLCLLVDCLTFFFAFKNE